MGINVSSATMYPVSPFFVPASAYSAVIQGTWAYTSGQNWGQYYLGNSTTNQNDEINYSVNAPGGSYKLVHFGVTSNNVGKLKVYVDGVEVMDEDLYSVGAVWNVTKTSSAFTLGGTDAHTIRFVVYDKNGASSDYLLPLYGFWLVKQ